MNQNKKEEPIGPLIASIIIVTILVIGGIFSFKERPLKKQPVTDDPQGAEFHDIASITNFDQCVGAGFAIMKSYPAQCMTSDGRIFVKDKKPSENESVKTESSADGEKTN